MPSLDFLVYIGIAIGAIEILCIIGMRWGIFDKNPHFHIIGAVVLLAMAYVVHTSGFYQHDPVAMSGGQLRR